MRDYRYRLYEQKVDTRALDDMAKNVAWTYMGAADEIYETSGEFDFQFDQDALASLFLSLMTIEGGAIAKQIEEDADFANQIGAEIFVGEYYQAVGITYKAKAGKVNENALSKVISNFVRVHG